MRAEGNGLFGTAFYPAFLDGTWDGYICGNPYIQEVKCLETGRLEAFVPSMAFMEIMPFSLLDRS